VTLVAAGVGIAGATSAGAAAQPAGVASTTQAARLLVSSGARSGADPAVDLDSLFTPLTAPAPTVDPRGKPIDGRPAREPTNRRPHPRKHHPRKHHPRKHHRKHHARKHHRRGHKAHRHLTPHGIARRMLRNFGWSQRQFKYLNWLWDRESSWNVHASNPYSGAYGIPQAVPGSKMSTAGSDWRTSARTQIRWGLRYIDGRYGSPQNAWDHEISTGWY
jgi:hypothetical protein